MCVTSPKTKSSCIHYRALLLGGRSARARARRRSVGSLSLLSSLARAAGTLQAHGVCLSLERGARRKLEHNASAHLCDCNPVDQKDFAMEAILSWACPTVSADQLPGLGAIQRAHQKGGLPAIIDMLHESNISMADAKKIAAAVEALVEQYPHEEEPPLAESTMDSPSGDGTQAEGAPVEAPSQKARKKAKSKGFTRLDTSEAGLESTADDEVIDPDQGPYESRDNTCQQGCSTTRFLLFATSMTMMVAFTSVMMVWTRHATSTTATSTTATSTSTPDLLDGPSDANLNWQHDVTSELHAVAPVPPPRPRQILPQTRGRAYPEPETKQPPPPLPKPVSLPPPPSPSPSPSPRPPPKATPPSPPAPMPPSEAMLSIRRTGASLGPNQPQDTAGLAIDGRLDTGCASIYGRSSWLSIRFEAGGMPARGAVHVQIYNHPDESRQASLSGLEVWRGAAWGDFRSQFAWRCSGEKPLELPATAGPFSFVCHSGRITFGDFITLRQAGDGPARQLAVAEVYAYTNSPPAAPPISPPPLPPPLPPSLPPSWPSPPQPPRPPQHPPVKALEADWHVGFATRYWDCCKPACSWPQAHTAFGEFRTPLCSKSGVHNTKPYGPSGCSSPGDSRAGFACYNQGPWPDSLDPEQLAYGFVAAPRLGAHCNSCLEFDFTESRGHYEPDDVGSQRLRGKKMIVQATNVGDDVALGQFDLMIPGGGVGLFNGCAAQWGSGKDLGITYGGFLSKCQGCAEPGTGCKPERRPYEEIRQCVLGMCDSTFGEPHLAELKASCHWFVSFFEVADNPTFRYRAVECPQAIWDRLALSGAG